MEAEAAVDAEAEVVVKNVADKSWKSLIEGKPHGTSLHRARVYRQAIRAAKSGNYEKVFINKQLRTVTGKAVNSTLRPDVSAVLKGSGKIDMIEVRHPRQTAAPMLTKIQKMENLLGHRAGVGSYSTPPVPE